MIKFDKGILAYTTRDVRNYGFFKSNSLYKYLFTREDNMLLNTGAIKLLPYSMFKFYTSHSTILNGKKYEEKDLINYNDFTESVIRTLVKTNVIRCELAEEFQKMSEEKLIECAKVYECVGLTFGEVSKLLDIDFNILKEKFNLKQGGKNRKINIEDINNLQEILTGV